MNDGEQEIEYQWLLFIRHKDTTEFLITVIFQWTLKSTNEMKCSLFEYELNAMGIQKQIEELGMETTISSFLQLFQKTLETRTYVDLDIEWSDISMEIAPKVYLLLTFQVGSTIARKSVLELPLQVSEYPTTTFQLLKDMHEHSIKPIFTQQEIQKQQDQLKINLNLKSSSIISTHATSNDNSTTNTSTSTVLNPSGTSKTLKRRLVPGATKRKQLRGAKLIKK